MSQTKAARLDNSVQMCDDDDVNTNVRNDNDDHDDIVRPCQRIRHDKKSFSSAASRRLCWTVVALVVSVFLTTTTLLSGAVTTLTSPRIGGVAAAEAGLVERVPEHPRGEQPPQQQQHQHQHRRLQAQQQQPQESGQDKTRILYIITTLAEYNSGTRNTVRGSDRLQETLIPVVSEGVRSMVAAGYHVDVFLVCHWLVRPERLALVRRALPAGVGLDYWNSSTPLGYDTGKEPFVKLENRTLHLARQHRFVIKDKLTAYDMFVCFEDDMLIKGGHVDHFRAVSAELRRLREAAPTELPKPLASASARDTVRSFAGTMTKDMLKRVIPGFIRVEVLLDETKYPAQSDTGPVPVDLSFDNKNGPEQQQQVDASQCCHVSERTVNDHIPGSPEPDRLMLWETNILPLGIRQMPTDSWLDWVVLQRGPNQDNIPKTARIGDYWSNRGNYYWPDKNKRPAPQEFKFINNQGGWMATREQLWEWHTEICPGGFLPPYEPPHYRYDGLDMRNVEWYSGGMQLSTVRHACNMQRIILLEPSNFSKSLIYHSANNKQRQLTGKREEVFTKANTLLGQLNAVKKRAAAELLKGPLAS